MKHNEDGVPEVKRGNWKIMVPVMVVLLLALLWGFYGTDEKLRPWDDLKLSAGPMPDPAVNGYQFLKGRWEGLPFLRGEDWGRSQKMSNGDREMDDTLLAEVKTGRETTRAELTQALEMPEWRLPLPSYGESEGYRWMLDPIRVFHLEAAFALQAGDPVPSLNLQRDARRLAVKHMHGSGGLSGWLSGLFIEGVAAEIACDAIDRNLMNSDQLEALGKDWQDDPDAREALKTALQFECEFMDQFLNVLKSGTEVSYDLPPPVLINRLRLKRNGTRNLYFAGMRRAVSAGLLPFPDRAAYEEAVCGPELDTRLEFLKELDPNYYGRLFANSVSIARCIRTTGYQGIFVPRAMRVRIALQRWRLVNPGKWPASLTELEPDFLPAVPEDPWNGNALLWDPVGHVIYAVGSDWKTRPPVFKLGAHGWSGDRGRFCSDPEFPGLRLEIPPLKPVKPVKSAKP